MTSMCQACFNSNLLAVFAKAPGTRTTAQLSRRLAGTRANRLSLQEDERSHSDPMR